MFGIVNLNFLSNKVIDKEFPTNSVVSCDTMTYSFTYTMMIECINWAA